MAAKIIIIFLFIISVAAILVLYAYKLAFHFMYTRLKDRKKAGSTADFFYRNFNDTKDSDRWKQAWMLFPLLFPVVFDDERLDLNDVKYKIKKLNMAIYAGLSLALIVVFYAAQAFPEGIL